MNSTILLTTVSVDGVEPIVCTPEHPFYILNPEYTLIVEFEGRESNDYQGQWVTAGNLKVGHKVLLSNGKNGIINSVETEELDEPVATYNFEVQDYHTYYVGSEGILVHNACGDAFDVMQFDDAAVAEARQPIVNSKGVARDPSFSTFKRRLFSAQDRLHPGTFDAGTTNIIRGQKVILHHPLGRAGANLYNVVGVSQSQHLAIHAIIGYQNANWLGVSYNLGSGVF